MEIILNGQKAQAAEGEPVSRLIHRLGLAGPVAVMVNGDIVHRDKLDSTTLKTGDHVELLRMMGGG
jgi:thiamine biosynthesis protein ThiS